ncbi:MAG: UDP-N-acetylmuramate--L-alanine ligase [Alphaproteobacteria bacterium]
MTGAMPFDIGTLHFIGIGGIGMSGIAEVMHTLGYKVQGSDVAENANVKRLRALGIPVTVGHDAANLGDAAVAVVSSAIKAGNPELDAARAARTPVVPRAEMLGELMRLKWSVAIGGTHGKTTTTSMVAALLDAGGMDPTVINGGVINAYGTNARLGKGDWMVVEADESDGSFVNLPATVAVVTNIDREHMDYYDSFADVRDAFQAFVANIPFYGFAVMCIDHPEVQALIPALSDRKVIAYGKSRQADVRATNIAISPSGAQFDVEIGAHVTGGPVTLRELKLPMAGEHNVLNACAAIACAIELGVNHAAIRKGLARFGGVKRRFTHTGTVGGITVIDDYGHHPVEIAAVLAAARGTGAGHVIAVVQPHRYTRLSALFDDFCTCFNDADAVLVADVYPAGEAPIEGVDRDALVSGLRAHGHRHAEALDGPDALAGRVVELARPGDLVVCLGAGSVTAWANALPEQLAAILEPEPAAAGGQGR